jgi:glycosyltransferase involved in cell wall biosynthesis
MTNTSPAGINTMPGRGAQNAHASTYPLVSIGLPVYNGERCLRLALDSLVAQDYPNFEIIICDNASADSTEAICREYAARDRRIHYHRGDCNRGAVWSFNRVFELSTGRYFMWAAHDDLRDAQYLRCCVEALERNPAAVMCCTDVKLIDEQGREVSESQFPHGIRPLGATPWERIHAIAKANYWYDFYGLIRSEILAQTRLCQRVWGFDVVLLLELCLRGGVAYVPRKLFVYRVVIAKTAEQVAGTLAPTGSARDIPWSWTQLSL